MKKFTNWDGTENLNFWVAVKLLTPENLGKWAILPKYQAGIAKMEEEDEPDLLPQTGTRRPTNRQERRKATARAKIRRQKLAKYSDDFIMPNSGKVKDTGYRSYEKGAKVYHRNKKIQVESTVSPFDPWEELELEHFDYEEFYEVDSDGDRIWKKAENLHEVCPCWVDEYVEDEYVEDEVTVPTEEEYLRGQVNYLENQTYNLKNEVTRLNSFLQEFNLNKLYERWLQENNYEFF